MFKCPYCKDLGYNDGAISYQEYGTSEKTFCRECEKGSLLREKWIQQPAQQTHFKEWKQAKIDRAMQLSGVEGFFKERRLSDLKKGSSLARDCEKYVEGWKEMKLRGLGFYFWGMVGAGKTFTATALANELMEKQMVEVLFLSMPETVSRVKSTFDKTIKTEDAQLFERMKTVELLVIDDLGVEKRSEWLDDQLYQVIDYRWRNRRPMIVTSNQSLEDLRNYYKPQISSRLSGCCKSMKFANKDRRIPVQALF